VAWASCPCNHGLEAHDTEEFGSSSSSSYIYSICANYSPAQAQQEVTLIGNPYMFTAREYDIETGLYYYRARYYNPYIGRFLQTDPAYQGMNWYAYCMNNPLNYTDPSGLEASYECNFPTSLITYTKDVLFGVVQAECGEKENNPLAMAIVYNWLARAGLFSYGDGKFKNWYISKVYVFYPNDEPLHFQVVFETKDTTYYHFTIGEDYAQVIYDNSTIGHDDREWVQGGIPLLYLSTGADLIGLLDDRLINRIIKPALSEVDAYAYVLSGMPRVLRQQSAYPFILMNWDSWFHEPKCKFLQGLTGFLYGGTLYGGADINYIVGGYAFNKLGFWYWQMDFNIWAWKNTAYGIKGYRSVGDLAATYFWAEKGWHMAE
jgi:RHS repeat-associated protein